MFEKRKALEEIDNNYGVGSSKRALQSIDEGRRRDSSTLPLAPPFLLCCLQSSPNAQHRGLGNLDSFGYGFWVMGEAEQHVFVADRVGRENTNPC